MDSIYVTSKKLHIACPLPQRSQFDIDERCKLERNTLMQCASAAVSRMTCWKLGSFGLMCCLENHKHGCRLAISAAK